MDVLHPQVDAAGADGLAQTVVGVVLVVGKYLLPAVDQAGGHGLGPDVHQPPLVQQIAVQIGPAGLNGVQQVLAPGHQQPHDGAFLLRHRPEDPLRLHPPQQHRPAAGEEASEPVHLRPRMVERRDAEENVLTGLAVVALLGLAGADQGPVVM